MGISLFVFLLFGQRIFSMDLLDSLLSKKVPLQDTIQVTQIGTPGIQVNKYEEPQNWSEIIKEQNF
jgi:hypothetical protein